MTAPAPLALQVTDLGKRYGGTVALDGLSLEVRAGEIHALLGQNGCGKSTFVKILTGVVAPDSGGMRLAGQPLALAAGGSVPEGIAVVHQDVGVVGSLSVLDNLGVVARYDRGLLGRIDVRAERALCTRLLRELDIALPLDAPASALTPAERSLLGIVRALRTLSASPARKLLVLDEPTAALSGADSDKILRAMRRTAELGCAVIFISHRLAEVMACCDRASILRAGRRVASVAIAETDRAELVALMLGRGIGDFYPAPPPQVAGAPRLRIEALRGQRLRRLDLEIGAGEVVGITGLAGMGHAQVLRFLSGAETPAGGRAWIDGAPMAFGSPAAAIRQGVLTVPADRLRDGIWSTASARENVTQPLLRAHFRFGRLDQARLQQRAAQALAGVALDPRRLDAPMSALSGGNQQKVVLAKWLQLRPRVLLMEEPTQGVDPGAAKQILELVMAAARDGTAVLVVSGEHEQLAAICHRVLVLRDGQVAAVLHRDGAISESALLHAMESEHVPATEEQRDACTA